MNIPRIGLTLILVCAVASGPAFATAGFNPSQISAPAPGVILVDGAYGACTDKCKADRDQCMQDAGVDSIHGGSDEQLKKDEFACAEVRLKCDDVCDQQCKAGVLCD